jgi:hypothetical protein
MEMILLMSIGRVYDSYVIPPPPKCFTVILYHAFANMIWLLQERGAEVWCGEVTSTAHRLALTC